MFILPVVTNNGCAVLKDFIQSQSSWTSLPRYMLCISLGVRGLNIGSCLLDGQNHALVVKALGCNWNSMKVEPRCNCLYNVFNLLSVWAVVGSWSTILRATLLPKSYDKSCRLDYPMLIVPPNWEALVDNLIPEFLSKSLCTNTIGLPCWST